MAVLDARAGSLRSPRIAACALAAASLALTGAPASAQHSGVEVSAAVQHDISAPLRSVVVSAPSAANLKERPLRLLPAIPEPNLPDPVVQGTATLSAAATAGLGFAGVGQGDYGFAVRFAPPDTNLAVGATQVVQSVNVSFAVFDKATGALILAPTSTNAVWAGFGGGCETNNDGDAIVQYDKVANRWIVTQFSVSTTPYLECVAVSTTSDATGSYARYAFNYGNTQFPDYPKLSVWTDAYYVTYNIFNNGSTFAGAKLCAFDRAAMLQGGLATQQCFQLSTSFGGVLSADLDGTGAPPAGAPGVFLNKGANALNLWAMKVDWTTPANTTLTGPSSLAVAAFTSPSGSVAVQPNTRQKLDSLGDRVMYRLAYRNFGTYESMVVNHAAIVGSSRKNQTMGVRWYELRRTGGAAAAWSVYQQGTYSPDASFRWMGSIAQDKIGNVAMGYSVSSSTVFPSVRYTGRVPTDPLGTMQAEAEMKTGAGSQLPNLSRWGDYSSIVLDPVDDCTFWYTNEYLKASGTFNWSTWIGSFKMPGC